MTRIFPQEIPEKLPIDQLWRFTISESSANVTTKSVTAEQIYPIMTPLTTSIDICRSFFEIRSTNPMEIIAPANAARISANELIFNAFPRKNTMTSATTSFAPEEMPSTNGPASGL